MSKALEAGLLYSDAAVNLNFLRLPKVQLVALSREVGADDQRVLDSGLQADTADQFELLASGTKQGFEKVCQIVVQKCIG